ncbi:hypothetical protein COLO4_26530 [Corchorus olitorius]|uniref:Uncharacterized protein n=1 Tax=Corchorus olitorius TaxID=93759 RepID=A0A1R3HWW5_9ROSI|nr:hypothetical protein COLO4_26530 [Corchorus olitorius]
MDLVIASSSIDGGIGCWDLQTGVEQLRYKTCASPSHGLVTVGGRFLASSQLRDPSATSGHVLYWSWSKVATGRLLKKWHAHYRAVTCLVFSEDNSLLISGSEDGCIRVWSLFLIFDDFRRQQASHLYEYSFTEHTLRVTDIVIGYGGGNAIIVSASEDRTCKVWSLSRGRLVRNIVFPSIIDAIAIDPGEHVFYAGSRDGKIYIAALGAESSPSSSYGPHIIGSLSDHGKAVTCLAYSTEGNSLLSGSEDGIIRVWDVRTQSIIRMFRHAKGPVNNILIVRRPISSGQAESNAKASSRKHELSLPPPLEKYANSTDEDMDDKTIITLPNSDLPPVPSYLSSQLISDHIKELQQRGSSAAAEMEVERLKLDCKRSMQMVHQWKKIYGNLQEFCVNELLDGEQMESSEGNPP